MKTYLFDTDILVDFFKRKKEAVNLTEKISKGHYMAISILTIAELRSGWDENEAQVLLPKLYSVFDIASISNPIAEKAGELRRRFGKKGVTLPTIDALIASTAIVNDYILITRNIKHFPMAELSTYPKPYGK